MKIEINIVKAFCNFSHFYQDFGLKLRKISNNLGLGQLLAVHVWWR